MGWFFSDYCVSPNFLVVLGLRFWLRLGLGCDNSYNSLVLSVIVQQLSQLRRNLAIFNFGSCWWVTDWIR